MSLFDELKRIARPYDGEEEEYEEEEDYVAPPRREKTRDYSNSQEFSPSESRRSAHAGNKVMNIHTTTQLQVVVVSPEEYEAAAEIADHLRAKSTVVLNLEGTEEKVARRVLDFLAGVAYANDGKIKKVAKATFIVTPYNVDILGDELLDQLEDNGMFS